MLNPIIPGTVIFLAVYVQSMGGFGVAILSIVFLTQMGAVEFAAPLVALVASTTETLLLIRFHRALKPTAIWRFTMASILGVPFGVFALRSIDDRTLLPALGAVLFAYALYSLLDLTPYRVAGAGPAVIFGFFSGALRGAYNCQPGPISEPCSFSQAGLIAAGYPWYVVDPR